MIQRVGVEQRVARLAVEIVVVVALIVIDQVHGKGFVELGTGAVLHMQAQLRDDLVHIVIPVFCEHKAQGLSHTEAFLVIDDLEPPGAQQVGPDDLRGVFIGRAGDAVGQHKKRVLAELVFDSGRGLLLERFDVVLQLSAGIFLRLGDLDQALGQQHGFGFVGGHRLDQLVRPGVFDQHGAGCVFAQQLAKGAAIDVVALLRERCVAIKYASVLMTDLLGIGFAHHLKAFGFGLGDDFRSGGVSLSLIAGWVSADVCALHVGKQVGVGAGALGAVLATAGGFDQARVCDLELGQLQAQHDVLLQPGLKRAHARRLSIAVF